MLGIKITKALCLLRLSDDSRTGPPDQLRLGGQFHHPGMGDIQRSCLVLRSPKPCVYSACLTTVGQAHPTSFSWAGNSTTRARLFNYELRITNQELAGDTPPLKLVIRNF